MIRTFNYPLKPTVAQNSALTSVLGTCQQLYNAALEQRIHAYRKQGKTLTLIDQQRDLTDLRRHDEAFSAVAATILRSALIRIDLAYKGFFERIRRGEKPGFPRFRSRERYDSFSFPCQPGVNVIRGAHVRIPALGNVKFKQYRPVRGIPKIVHIRRTGTNWALSIVCDLGTPPVKVNINTSTGIDVGLTVFATLASGKQIENPRFYRKSQELLADRQRKLATKKKSSSSRSKARCLVVKAHRRIKNQRLDFLRKLAKTLVTTYDLIAYEDLKIKNMVRGNLAKSIHDASWGIFINCIKSKAEEAGKYAVGVNPRGTSQRCSRCAHVPIERKTLADRVHFCESCKLRIDRDYNAAINIHALGLSAVNPALLSSGLIEAVGVT